MSSFPFLPKTISLVDRHSGIYQGTRRCRCSYSTGTVTAGNVQIERSRCAETSADAEHFYLITYTSQRSKHCLSDSPDASPSGPWSSAWRNTAPPRAVVPRGWTCDNPFCQSPRKRPHPVHGFLHCVQNMESVFNKYFHSQVEHT